MSLSTELYSRDKMSNLIYFFEFGAILENNRDMRLVFILKSFTFFFFLRKIFHISKRETNRIAVIN